MKTPVRVNQIYLECTRADITARKWDQLMEGATHANKRAINAIVRAELAELAEALCLFDKPLKDLSWYNPYNYFKTNRHLVLVHSSIEYFLRFN